MSANCSGKNAMVTRVLLLVCAVCGSRALVAPARRRRFPAARRAVDADGAYDACAAAARAAGALIVAAGDAERAVEVTKANAKDLLTRTDVACQRAVVAALRARAPGARVLGEEDVAPGAAASAAAAAAAFADAGLCYVVDPIDGTANFVDGIPPVSYTHLTLPTKA